MKPTIKRHILRYKAGRSEEIKDIIAVEKKLKISVNGRPILSLYCTPTMLRELVTGILMTGDLIEGKLCAEYIAITEGNELTANISAEIKIKTKEAVLTSGCVGGVTFPQELIPVSSEKPFSIKTERLIRLYSRFQSFSGLYKVTGCVHTSALSDGKKIVIMAEDIGRHNALDKVIGRCLLEGIPFEGKLLLTSGRVSSEIAYKCARWGIPIIVSRTAPTDLAINIADESGITLIGFLRGQRFNVYTHIERVL